MTSRHDSVRLDRDTFERLEAQSRRTHQSRSQVVKALLEEGLRMAAHPGVVFRSGPAGRRPGLAAGPDVWDVIRVLRVVEGRGEETLRRTAGLTGLPEAQVAIALRYYADYPEEIDAWIQRVDEGAAQAEAAWVRAQNLLGR